jgi:nucleolar protein 4
MDIDEPSDSDSDCEDESKDDDESDDDNDDAEKEKLEVQRIEELKRQKRQQSDADEGATLFVRNVSFESCEEDLQELFEEYGIVRYAVMVRDKRTGLPNGNAFVKFATTAMATKALEEAYRGVDRKQWRVRRGDAKRHSARGGSALAKAMLTDRLESNLTLDGRKLIVMRAVSRDAVSKMATGDGQKKDSDAKASARSKDALEKANDRRNLWLANEGHIDEESSAARGVSQQDMHRRADAHKRKKTLLGNPNYFVSKTRLCVRNLPRTLDDDKDFKQLVLEHARNGLRLGLAPLAEDDTVPRRHQSSSKKDDDDDDAFDVFDPFRGGQVINDDGSDKSGKARRSSKQDKALQLEKILRTAVKVLQAKIVREKGTSKSKCFGFAEFEKHEHALASLRSLNNNPSVFGARNRPIVEFALENVNALKKLERLQESSRQHQQLSSSSSSSSTKKLTRWQKRKLRKQQDAEARERGEDPEAEREKQHELELSEAAKRRADKLKKRAEAHKERERELKHGANMSNPGIDDEALDRAAVEDDDNDDAHENDDNDAEGDDVMEFDEFAMQMKASTRKRAASSHRAASKESAKKRRRSKREREEQEEQEFDKIVANYRSRLFKDLH